MILVDQTQASQSLDSLVAGRYEIDAGHSTVGFEVRHLMLTRTRGVFQSVSGVIVIDEDITRSSVEVAIDAASIDTSNAERDEHLRSADFLSAATHPYVLFSSRGVQIQGDRLLVDGDLSIAGISRPVTLLAGFQGGVRDPWGGDRIAFTASTQIDRHSWGMTWNVPMEGSGLVVGKDVRIAIEVEALRITTTG